MIQFKPGDRVRVYDRYRFALPVDGVIKRLGSSSKLDPGAEVQLDPDSHGRADLKNPDGVWIFLSQLRPLRPKPKKRVNLPDKTYARVDKQLQEALSLISSVRWDLSNMPEVLPTCYCSECDLPCDCNRGAR